MDRDGFYAPTVYAEHEVHSRAARLKVHGVDMAPLILMAFTVGLPMYHYVKEAEERHGIV